MPQHTFTDLHIFKDNTISKSMFFQLIKKLFLLKIRFIIIITVKYRMHISQKLVFLVSFVECKGKDDDVVLNI